MNRRLNLRNGFRVQFKTRATARNGMLGFVILLLLVWDARAGGIVTNTTEANLRAAIAGGGMVTFACDGNISVANSIAMTNAGPVAATVLNGVGHQISLSGMQGVFYVGTNVYVTLANLSITNSRVTGGGTNPNPARLFCGAGIFNDGGVVRLLAANFFANGAASGGAVFNQSSGIVNAIDCTFFENVAGPGQAVPGYDGPGRGGAIFSDQSGQVSLQNCIFLGNRATGGPGLNQFFGGSPSQGFEACGGAVAGGTLFVSSCTFSGNSASGGDGDAYYGSGSFAYSGGVAHGGAIYASATIVGSCFFSNNVTGGKGGTGRYGLGIGFPFGGDGGPGGNGGGAIGGALDGAPANVVNSTFAFNTVTGGSGGQGGHGGNGSHLYSVSPGNGGPGGMGGSALAAVTGASLTNCTIAFNSASSFGGAGGFAGTCDFYPCGSGPTPTNGSMGAVGNINGGLGGSLCVNTLLASNSPNGNCYGTLTDLGHNLSSDASCAFSATGSTNGVDAMVGSLLNNGGPTLSMALLLNSPAIDAGDNASAPYCDQRGMPRPAGSASDIGAFEYGSTVPMLNIASPGDNLMNILVHGNSNQWCRLLVSSNLADWIPFGTHQIGPDGIVNISDGFNLASKVRFYRVVMP